MASNGKTTKTLVWILMGMLVLGLGGFGVTNLSGNLRTIGTVGDKELDINVYSRALQQEIRAFEAQTGQSLNFAQIQQFGIDANVLSRVVSTRALDHEAAQLGLSIGDTTLSRQILEISAFQGIDGNFDREGYKFALQQQGLSETQFEVSLREETARTLLQGAIVSGTTMPDIYTETLINYIGERRDFAWVRFSKNDLAAPLPAPTEAELAAYHSANEAQFTLPEMKRITYALLVPNMLIDTVELSDTALRELYTERAGEFVQPERRLVERLVFPDDAAAETAKIALESNETSFEELVAGRGLALSDIDLGDVTREALGDAGGAVFNGIAGTVVGPFESSLGPALFRVNGVLPARETSFEEALPMLRDALASDRTRRMIDDQIENIEDLLAGGATIEELASETDMELETLDWHSGNGEGAGAYTAFSEAASLVTVDDFPEVIQLDDGGIVALRLDEILAPRLQPVGDVQEELSESWRRAETDKRLFSQAEALVAQIAAGAEMSAGGLVVTKESGLMRTDYIEGTPAAFMEDIFSMSIGDLKIVDSFGSVMVVRLDDIRGPDTNNPELKVARQRLEEQAAAAISQDLYAAFAGDARARAGVILDQRAINAVNANFQ